MTDPETIAKEVGRGWLAQSFRISGRDIQDVPRCIVSRSSVRAILTNEGKGD